MFKEKPIRMLCHGKEVVLFESAQNKLINSQLCQNYD